MKKTISIVGGGTAALFLAAFLNPERYEVTIFERKSALGRKFLVAGDGGFNLTHSEKPSTFKLQYTPEKFLDRALDRFNNEHLRAWLLELGIPTFVGSSGRVFPEKGIKPIDVLKRIETHLKKKGVKFEFNKTFTSWDKDGRLKFNAKEMVKSDYTVFALGGSSWKVTGSDGSWIKAFAKKGIETIPFKAANCAYHIKWPEKFIQKHEGKPLKNIAISIKHKIQKGEAVITKLGLEGNAIYGLSSFIQDDLSTDGKATVYVDFKPTYPIETLISKIRSSTSNTTVTLKEKIKLSAAQLDLIKMTLSKEEYLKIETLAKFIKNFPLDLLGSAPIDEAISTSGGVSLDAIDSTFEIKALENQFCIGEMLDWNAPTGGYLIQACASMGVELAHQLNKRKNQ
ncbi:MAG: NAD(P)-dependent oxidoreductase [Vicingaceae bacterium]